MTRVVGATIVALLGASSGALAQPGEWRAYSADLAGSKYSSLDQITAENLHSRYVIEIDFDGTGSLLFIGAKPGGGDRSCIYHVDVRGESQVVGKGFQVIPGGEFIGLSRVGHDVSNKHLLCAGSFERFLKSSWKNGRDDRG